MTHSACAAFQRIFPEASWRRKRLKAGAVLFRRGEAAGAIFIVVEGAIRLEHVMNDGERSQHTRIGAGQVIGETSFFVGTFGCDGIAEELTEVAVLARRELVAHVRQNPEAGLALARLLSDEVVMLRERLALLQLRSAKDRVLAWLSSAQGNLVIDTPWIEVAVHLGLSHEALYRTLATLARERRIWRRGRAVRLLR
jgi:CRP/FNR family transcriptional regulator, dissimilatory nitrate respiration regulator